METERPIDRSLLSLILSGRLPEPDWESFSAADWEALARLAQREEVAPLLYWSLSQSGRLGRLPGPLQASLRALYFGIRMKNEQSLKQLGRLASLLHRDRIPVVVLKGACFALTIYPDIGLRPMADLDLLVPASRSAEAIRSARSLGYTDAVPEALPGLNDLLSHAACLKKRDTPYTTLEVHHTLVADSSFTHAVPADWFWSQTEPLKGTGLEDGSRHVRMLTPTAQLLYACAHAMLQHGGRNTSLRWLYDLDRLIETYAGRIDWGLLVSQARAFEWSSAISAALAETSACFATRVPERVLEELSRQPDRNAARVRSLLSQPATHTLEEYQKLQSLDGYGRLRLTLALLMPTPAYMRWRYGLRSAWTLPGWYLYRWWGIFKDAVKTLWLITHRRVS